MPGFRHPEADLAVSQDLPQPGRVKSVDFGVVPL
jgi:hypothetical protein